MTERAAPVRLVTMTGSEEALPALVLQIEAVRRDAATVEARLAPLCLAEPDRALTDAERALKVELLATVLRLADELRDLEALIAARSDPASAPPGRVSGEQGGTP